MRISDWSSDVCSSDLYKLNIPIARIDEIFQELSKLEIEKNKNAIAILMRIVLEMTVDEYLDEKKISRKRGNPPHQKDNSRSKERRVGKECISTCRSRCWSSH